MALAIRDASIVVGVSARGNKKHDIAAWFGETQARITSSIAGILIRPSHNVIIFALATGRALSISKLFLAGVLMYCCLAITAYIVAGKRGCKAE